MLHALLETLLRSGFSWQYNCYNVNGLLWSSFATGNWGACLYRYNFCTKLRWERARRWEPPGGLGLLCSTLVTSLEWDKVQEPMNKEKKYILKMHIKFKNCLTYPIFIRFLLTDFFPFQTRISALSLWTWWDSKTWVQILDPSTSFQAYLPWGSVNAFLHVHRGE